MKSCLLLFLAFAGTAGAVREGQSAEPLRLEDAVSRSLATHPAIAAETAELRAAQARAEREALPTPYVVGGDLDNVLGSGALGGLRSAETTLRLGRVIELGDKRSARQAVGRAEVARQSHLADQARIDIASRTTARFIEVVADQHRLAFATERVDLARRTRREVAAWVSAARNPETDLHAADIALADAELELEHAEHELGSARVTLAASWGAPIPDFEHVAGEINELPSPESIQSLQERLPRTTAQRSSELEAESILAHRRVAESLAKPDVNLSLGVRRLEALDEQGLVMSVSVPLGNRQRSVLAIAEADAQLAAVEARRAAHRSEANQVLFEKYQELLHGRAEFESIRTRMLPKAQQALAFARRGFAIGRFSYAALAQAQRTLFELRERSVDAAARYHTLLAEIERLTAITPEPSP